VRKLALASFSFSAAILMCHYIIPVSLHLWIIVGIFISTLCACMLRGKIRTCILLMCIFFIFGVLRYDVHAEKYRGIENGLLENDYRITAYVADFPEVYDNYSKITVRLDTDLLPKVKVILYDYGFSTHAFVPGDMIRTTVDFSSASLSYGQEVDTYISKGIYLRGTIKDEIKQYNNEWGKIVYFPLHLAHNIQQVLDEFLSARTSVFMKALMTGEKNPLYNSPEIDNILQRAGLLHVVAVSGMHISFLVGMILMLFGNRTGWIASVFSIFIFSVMTGMSPSVLRAAFMQILTLLAPIVHRESDGITSVSFALLILLMVNPFAVASVSLQLSFAAIMGIILVTPKTMEWFLEKCANLHGYANNLYYFIASSLSASLGASIFTIPLCAIHFGNVAVFAPISNLLVLWIVPCCFVLGFALCAVSLISTQLASLLGMVLNCMVEFIYWISELLSSVSFSTVYLPPQIMLFWLICVYAVFLITYFVKREKQYRPLIPCGFAIILLITLVTGVRLYYENGTTVAAIDVGQGQCIAVLNQDDTVLIDCGGKYDSGQIAVNWLYGHGREDVDLLILTHFDSDHINGLNDLITQINVREIMCCSVRLSDSEYASLSEIKVLAEKYNTKLTTVNLSNKTAQGNIKIGLYVSKTSKDNNGLISLISVNDFDALITGDADMNAEQEMIRYFAIPDGECLIVGHHGSKYSTSEALLDKFKPDFAFISCGYNQYGHPTEEVLDRLNARNVVIYRTDILGSVEVKVH